ncbi:MAG: baseplate wedge protein 53 [Candidatus Nanopelagicaceae bacterium]
MYFNFLPSIKYDVKPISYPFSESDYVVAKNFFRRYKISDTAFNSTVFYKKYAIGDQVRLDQIAEAAYGNPFYDWVVALVNNMINPLYDLPMTEAELRKHIESSYSNPYYDIHHYEIIGEEEQTNKFGKVLMPANTWVDETFYNNKRVLTADTFPDLSSTTKLLRYNTEYIFSATSNLWDNSFVDNSFGATFETYGSGTGADGGFILPAPLRNYQRPTGYLRIRGFANQSRYVEFKELDTTHLSKFTMFAKFGSDTNGGEYPDLSDETLKLQYRNDPSEEWTTIDTIINRGVVQDFEYDGVPFPLTDPGYGGIGRPAGVYENVPVYSFLSMDDPTDIVVNVTVGSAGYVTDIEIVDRGQELSPNITNLYIKNEDIGNGYWFDDQGVENYLSDLFITQVSVRQTRSGEQYSRYGTEPYTYTVDIPQAARTPATQLRLYQATNSGSTFDQFGIQSIKYEYEQTLIVETDIKYTVLDQDNYIINGITWTRNNGTWYRVTEIGYRYYDNGQIKEISGSDLSRPVTEFEYESNENEKKREIYILKPAYLERLVEDFRKAALYKKSSDFVSNRLKKTGV